MEKKRFHTNKNIEPSVVAEELAKNFTDGCFAEEYVGDTAIFIFEKYYFRNDSLASCTVCMKQYEDGTEFLVVCSGAGSGLFRWSRGAEDDFICEVENVIQIFL